VAWTADWRVQRECENLMGKSLRRYENLSLSLVLTVTAYRVPASGRHDKLRECGGAHVNSP
jgi:hypothetical protein